MSNSLKPNIYSNYRQLFQEKYFIFFFLLYFSCAFYCFRILFECVIFILFRMTLISHSPFHFHSRNPVLFMVPILFFHITLCQRTFSCLYFCIMYIFVLHFSVRSEITYKTFTFIFFTSLFNVLIAFFFLITSNCSECLKLKLKINGFVFAFLELVEFKNTSVWESVNFQKYFKLFYSEGIWIIRIMEPTPSRFDNFSIKHRTLSVFQFTY